MAGAVALRRVHDSRGPAARCGGNAPDEALDVESRLFAAHGGAFPMRIKDVGVVGTVTVSSPPQADDHAFVIEMIGEFLGVSLLSFEPARRTVVLEPRVS